MDYRRSVFIVWATPPPAPRQPQTTDRSIQARMDTNPAMLLFFCGFYCLALPRFDRLVHRVEVERLRIPLPANPFQHFLVFGMFGIRDGIQEILIAPWAATVLGRTGARAFEAAWINRPGLRVGHALDLEAMEPVVAEVVPVAERYPPPVRCLLQGRACRAARPGATPEIEHLAGPGLILGLSDLKGPHVVIVPSHYSLNDGVQPSERHIARNLDSAPH